MIEAAALLRQAVAATGLDDFGDETLPDRFGQAVDHINEQGLDVSGERAAADVCLWLLASRLQVSADFARYPIGEERIERPVIAIGEGRAGTTLLHALLSVDPNGRALRFSEVMYPSPPPGLTGLADPRYARADDDWREINARLPGWLPMHPYNDMLGNGIAECERTWAFDFRALTPTAWWRVPMRMKPQGLPIDHGAQYRLHKMMLQQLQYVRPRKYWVLKGFHIPRLKTLFETYPDAQVIWTHRDPVQVIASAIALAGNLDEMLAGPIEWQELAQRFVAGLAAGYEAALASPFLDDARIHHVRYKDLVADPVGTLGAFYRKFDIPWQQATEQAMRGYIAENRSDRYGKFRYSTELLGDLDALHARFAPYRERFGIEIENR